MKESIGGTQLFVIVVTLVLLFTAIMAFTINHSNAFAVKDQVVSIIESAGGFDMSAEIVEGSGITPDETLTQIVEALADGSYRQTGRCPASDGKITVEAYQRNGAKVIGNNRAAFCIARIPSYTGEDENIKRYYYQVILFYSLDIPLVNELFNFKAIGETKPLYN